MPVVLLVAVCCALPLAVLAARSVVKPRKPNDIDRLVKERRKSAKKQPG